jgi:3-hydroxyisobutyrate dehydrogenase-like beta-hydroxyacid dehydrogenase
MLCADGKHKEEDMKVTVYGMGGMGRALAERLIERGHDVVVWNRTAARIEPLVEQGATAAPSIAAGAETAAVAITVLADDDAVRETVLGTGGVAASLSTDALLVDMSTVSPETSTALAQALPGRVVSAPIMGGPPAVRTGEVTLLLGGAPQVIARLDPLWRDVCARHVHTGDNASATTLKILSNVMLIGGIALLSEVLATGQARGVADETLRTVFAQSPMVAPGLRNRFEDLLHGEHKGWFSVALAEKDVRLALHLAERAGLRLITAQGALQLLGEAERRGYGDLDLASVIESVRASASSDA